VEERLGRYELRRAIGRGAAGTVYEAWDSTLARRVAVKVVRLSGQEGPRIDEFLARFRQEAQVASRLSHPGVVSVYDYGETEGETGGLAFIVNSSPARR
jgi:serine/threonine-protein kinase